MIVCFFKSPQPSGARDDDHQRQAQIRSRRTDGLLEDDGDRLGYRAGHYPRSLVTRAGKFELRVPGDREGRFSTELFERYQRSEQALVGALAEMYIQGVLDPQGQGDHGGAVRPQRLGVDHLADQQAPRRDAPVGQRWGLDHAWRTTAGHVRDVENFETPRTVDCRRSWTGRPPSRERYEKVTKRPL